MFGDGVYGDGLRRVRISSDDLVKEENAWKMRTMSQREGRKSWGSEPQYRGLRCTATMSRLTLEFAGMEIAWLR